MGRQKAVPWGFAMGAIIAAPLIVVQIFTSWGSEWILVLFGAGFLCGALMGADD